MLGATVDYTIILSRAYLDRRVEMEKRPAMLSAISYSAITILTSATILTVCGAFIGIISSNGVIAGLGTLIGRGAFIAALNTFLLLPILFMVLDKWWKRPLGRPASITEMTVALMAETITAISPLKLRMVKRGRSYALRNFWT